MLLLKYSPDNCEVNDGSPGDTAIQWVQRLDGLIIVRADGSGLIAGSKQILKFEDNNKIKLVTSAGLFLLDDGNLFELSHSLSIIHRPVAPSVKVALVASCRTYSVCMSTESCLFTWGYSSTGCLGLGPDVYQVSAPSFSKSFESPVPAIACSETHAIAASACGVYSWGEKSDGGTLWEPTAINTIGDVSKVACGRGQTLWRTLSKPRTVHLQGLVSGEVTLDAEVVKLIAESSSAAALLADGAIFTWGTAPYISQSSDFQVIDICFSADTAFLHALAKPAEPVVFSEHVRRGFRPGNLPAKSIKEAVSHQLEVARVLEASRRAREDERFAGEDEEYLKDWWNSALKGFEEVSLEMRSVWENHGLSDPARLVLWPIALGNEFHISRELYERYKEANHHEYSLVNLDMPRTFPELNILDPDSPFTRECSLLLKAYQTFAPDIGYVQGMSFVAVTLLMHMQSYPAFVCFCALMHFPILRILYRIKPEDMKFVFSLLDDYLQLNCPAVLAHLHGVDFKRELFLLDWFLTLFSKCLDKDTTASVWDIVILEGQRGIFQVATGLIMGLEKQISGQDFDGCVAVIQRGPKSLNRKLLLRKIRGVKHPQHADQFLENLEHR